MSHSLVNHGQDLRVDRLLHTLGLRREVLNPRLQLGHVVGREIKLATRFAKLTVRQFRDTEGRLFKGLLFLLLNPLMLLFQIRHHICGCVHVLVQILNINPKLLHRQLGFGDRLLLLLDHAIERQ